jgi:glutathione S-transferase
MSRLKLWGRRNSINVQKVCWMLAELDLEHERIDAGMAHGVVGEDWYARLNPNRLVPTLEDGDTVLWESNAIVRYLAAKYAPGRWMPEDAAGRAGVEQWMDWQQTTLMPGALSPLFLGLVRVPPDKRNAAELATSAAATEAAMRILDRHLEGRAYMLRDRPTTADIAIGAAVHRWQVLPVARPPLAALWAYYQRLTRRPAFVANVMLPLT